MTSTPTAVSLPAAPIVGSHGALLLEAHAPGVVMVYDRNAYTDTLLRLAGAEVVQLPGGELARGHGGSHRMSCPVPRDPP